MRSRSCFSLFVCAWSCSLLVSCAPTIMSFNHAPNPGLRQSRPFPATVAILPWDDKRQRIDNSSAESLLPLAPYAVHEFQNGPGIDWASMPESGNLTVWNNWARQNRSYVSNAPRGEEQFQPLLKRYLSETNTFREVMTAGLSLTGESDFAVRGTLYEWKLRGWQTFYGMSFAGCLLYYVGLPSVDDSLIVRYSLALIDGYGQREICRREYQHTVKQPAYRMYGPRIPGSDYEFEDLLPVVRESLEDFVRTVQKSLPPPSDTAYWNGIAEKRANRATGKSESKKL